MEPILEKIIKEKFPNGIRNDSIDITKLKKFAKEYDIEISDFDIEQIFDQLIGNNRIYCLREMLINEEEERKIEEQVNKWVEEFDFFEIKSLLGKFENAKFSIKFKMYEHFAKLNHLKMLQKTLKKIREIFDENGGEIEQKKFFKQLEHLTPETIKIILKAFFPSIGETKEGYFKDIEFIEGAKDIKEKLNNAEKKLAELGFVVSQNNLNLVLSLECGENFCEKYGLQDNKIFNKFREKSRWRKKN